MIAAIGQVRTFPPRAGGIRPTDEPALRARIEDLEEEVRGYRRVACLAAVQGQVHALQGVFRLSCRQALVLSLLLNAKGRVVTRDALLDAIYAGRDEAERKIIDVWVTKVRKQIGREHIATAWGSGYRLTAEGIAHCHKRLAERARAAAVITITLDAVMAMPDADLDNLAGLVREAQHRRLIERARVRS